MKRLAFLLALLFIAYGCYNYYPVADPSAELEKGLKYKIELREGKSKKLFYSSQNDSAFVFATFKRTIDSDKAFEIQKDQVEQILGRELKVAETVLLSIVGGGLAIVAIAWISFSQSFSSGGFGG